MQLFRRIRNFPQQRRKILRCKEFETPFHGGILLCMLDIKFIRENKDIVVAGAKKKHIEVDIDKLLALDDKRRAAAALAR